MIKQTKEEKELLKQQEAEQQRLEAEQKVDQETASRTARYDQDLKERARKYGINPDNFATEESLGEAVKKYEDEQGILGTPEERNA